MPNGPLSLPARLCLLAWDPTRSGAADTARVHHLVRAGALTELARRGLLTDDDGIATPVDLDSRTGDAVLDGLLELVRESLPHRWRTWVALHARVTFDAVREQLVAEGYLRAEKKRVLGVFPSVEHVLARPAVAKALREETREVLAGRIPAGEVSERDAAAAVLVAAAAPGLPAGVGHRAAGGGCGEERIAELTERGGTAAPGLRKIVEEVWGALSAESARAVASSGR
ncbi:GPP34 family phosphoprotein [Streptomyces sp. WAC 04229]|uniref:GOLPH3/VPS74 family protein n=1 Tax=Streptomyces sp. WAC 04229 TaxID=2203206 RepID=UPI000F745285|nr:GPP34 family phosphoprotein [Streptomyces sp. WAC 04229]RSN64614.1 GPP34 family phosphoprotein [Streptomyces sp. WAC 04229]